MADFTITKRHTPTFPDELKASDEPDTSMSCPMTMVFAPDGTVVSVRPAEGSDCLEALADSAEQALSKWEVSFHSDVPPADQYTYTQKITWKVKTPI